jgi:hypothetical protein
MACDTECVARPKLTPSPIRPLDELDELVLGGWVVGTPFGGRVVGTVFRSARSGQAHGADAPPSGHSRRSNLSAFSEQISSASSG